MKFVDKDGKYPIITITKEKTGSTADQRVLGYAGGRNITTQVDLYKATVIDTEDKNFKMTFSITRDAWTIEYGNGNTATNVGFEPKDGNINHYTGEVMKDGYPKGNGTTALKVTQYGSEVVHAESNETSVNMGYREKSDVAAGVMIHVGGNYDKNGSNTVAASEGCFGIVNPNNSSSNQSNKQSNNVLNTVVNQANKSKYNPGILELLLKKEMKTNIQKQKQFLRFIIIAFLTFSCVYNKEKPFKIKTILEGVYIENYCLYAYSDDFYSVNNDTFSLRSKIEYDTSNCLSFFVLYKPEGALEYTKDDVLKDPSLLYFTNGTYIQNWKNINDTLLFNGLDTLKVKSYTNENENKVMINWKDNDVIIFELH